MRRTVLLGLACLCGALAPPRRAPARRTVAMLVAPEMFDAVAALQAVAPALQAAVLQAAPWQHPGAVNMLLPSLVASAGAVDYGQLANDAPWQHSGAVDALLPSLVAANAGAVDYGQLANDAAKRAVGGGASGALAGVAQVLSLMWLRTAMNYEYRYGGNGTLNTVKTLWDEGGLPRLYRGLSFALVQSPLSRFGDAAANAAVPTLISTFCLQAGFAAPPIVATQFAASLTASTWRIAITPLDSLKTALQVEGNLTRLQDRIKADGVPTLWRGALTAAAATFVGNYPWFLTYNALDAALPTAEGYPPVVVLGRRALLGVCASCTSDVASNSLRVVKTGVQTADDSSSPLDVAKQVWAAEGPQGLFGRGLQTRLTVNCIQGAVFSVFWKYFEGVLLPKS